MKHSVPIMALAAGVVASQSARGEVFNLFNWNSNLSYGGTQFTAAGVPVASFGVPTGSYAARQAQVGMRLDW